MQGVEDALGRAETTNGDEGGVVRALSRPPSGRRRRHGGALLACFFLQLLAIIFILDWDGPLGKPRNKTMESVISKTFRAEANSGNDAP